jgi:hypothetical protein
MGCKSGKVQYGNESKAWIAAARCIELGILQDMQIYFCPFCRYYHLRTAKVQLHDDIWRPISQWSKRVMSWFKARGTIDQWDNE